MIDLPDHGYVNHRIVPLDPGGIVEGSLGGPSEIIDRPGYRYGVQFELPALNSDEARIFQALLEQASRDDVSYPWPLDFNPLPAGTPLVNGSTPPGSTIAIDGLVPNYQFKAGQPIAVVLASGIGYIHRITTAVVANTSGQATVSVFPLTRATFADNSVVEVEHPRIRGILSWEGSSQSAVGVRPFTFSISERA